ncbi:MAG: hypothetical protein AAB665_03755 [Patescibacteria group bacterium]
MDRKFLKALFTRNKSKPEAKESEPDCEATYIDDSMVRVKRGGKEIWIEVNPTWDLKAHEEFVSQMQDKSRPLPPVEALKTGVQDPVEKSQNYTSPDSASNVSELPGGQEIIAKVHGLSVNELDAILDFGRRKLYDRFKRRLRDTT